MSPLYFNFIDFEKAFDNVDRGVIWILTHLYGIPTTFVTPIQHIYELKETEKTGLKINTQKLMKVKKTQQWKV